jgi:hypothetical protein
MYYGKTGQQARTLENQIRLCQMNQLEHGQNTDNLIPCSILWARRETTR